MQLDNLKELQSWLDQSQAIVEELSSLDSMEPDQVGGLIFQ